MNINLIANLRVSLAYLFIRRVKERTFYFWKVLCGAVDAKSFVSVNTVDLVQERKPYLQSKGVEYVDAKTLDPRLKKLNCF